MKADLTYPVSKATHAYWPFTASSLRANSRHTIFRLRDLLSTLKTRISTASDPHVWETKNAAGQTVWNAYDPVSGWFMREASISEMRTWLERLYSLSQDQ